MKMRSLRQSIIDPKNAAELLKWLYIFQMGLELSILLMGSVGQRAAKLLAVNVGGLKKKSAIRPQPQSASLPGFNSGRSQIILKY